MSQLTIALCCNTSFGVVNFRAGLIRCLVERGHRVVVVAPRDAYSGRLASLGAEYVEWDVCARSTRIVGELRALRQLMRIYRDISPDIAFHFTIKAVIYGAIAARRIGTPFVSVITGLGYVFLNENWTSKLSRTLYRYTLNGSREVWFLNKDDCNAFETLELVEPSRVRLLPGEGVDMDHFAPDDTGAPVSECRSFLMIARLLKDKGVFEYVEAARAVRRRDPHVQFLLVGPADSANPTAIRRSQVQEWEDEGAIRYLGAVDDVRPAIRATTCVVLPSYREGTPRALLEAASMERPVVATDVPGCRDVVVPEATGLLCAVRDADDLAAKMQRIAGMSDAELKSMGQRARQFIRQSFDERLVIAEYLNALDRLVVPSAGTNRPA